MKKSELNKELHQILHDLYNYAYYLSYSRELAEDLVHEGICKILEKKGYQTLRSPIKFYVFRIIRNLFYDHYRKAEPSIPWEDDHLTSESLNIDDEPPFSTEDIGLLQSCLERISPLFREMLYLYYVKEVSIHEMASIYSVPDGTVKSRLFQARSCLKEQFEHESGGKK